MRFRSTLIGLASLLAFLPGCSGCAGRNDCLSLVHVLRYPGEVNSVAFSPDGEYAVASGQTGMRFWEVKSGKEFRHIPDAKGSLAFSLDGKLIVTGGHETLWDAESGKEIRRFEPHEGTTYCVAFSPAEIDPNKTMKVLFNNEFRAMKLPTDSADEAKISSRRLSASLGRSDGQGDPPL